ncbi:MAG: DUF499 domain-containing protein [Thermofilaceae archaeon]
MPALKPWYQVVKPREDLRRGIPLDASAFAIHLDQVIDGRAPAEYCDPKLFFARTYLTVQFRKLTIEVLRRLSGDVVGTSPGINLTTQFGGGKTHFLALLYHLLRAGDVAREWPGVAELLQESGLSSIPKARVCVFIGNRFDFLVGSGTEGEPKRKTPWGDLAWQLGGWALYQQVREHDERGVVPGGEIIQKVFTGAPTLILMDEVMSFIRRTREAGDPYRRLGSQFYSFLDVLTREIAGAKNVVLVISLPLSEYEMTPEDESEFQRLSKLLDRLSKAVILSEHIEIAEIVRRRLFEDLGDQKEIRRTAKAYADWIRQHKKHLPEWFPVEQAEKVFEATYPFHPTVLSVFERKWQSLPRFQRTRGILRLLALWVSHAWREGYQEGFLDPLITLGTAPLKDPNFRAAVFEQLGENLEEAILSDIAGEEAHAVRMDREASGHTKRLRLHQKVATTVFFEACGGQTRNEATLPEVRLAVCGPDVEIGEVENVLSDLNQRCYYLEAHGTAYVIKRRPKLNKILADRKAALSGPEAEQLVQEKVRQAIREVFRSGLKLERHYFPESPSDVPDTCSLRLVILAPEICWDNSERAKTTEFIHHLLHEYAGRGRTYKSSLIFVVAESSAPLSNEARTIIALESLEDPAEQRRLGLEEEQVRELRDKKRLSEQQLKELVWRVYRYVVLLDKHDTLRVVDLGLINSSTGDSLADVIIARLKHDGIVEDRVAPDFLVRKWPPAFEEEWSTASVRDAFFASPEFPRLLNPETLRETIAQGVRDKKFGYASKSPTITDVRFGDPDFDSREVEFSDYAVLIKKEKAGQLSSPIEKTEEIREDKKQMIKEESPSDPGKKLVRQLIWEGDLPHQKWTTFYTKVLTHFATDPSLRVRIKFEVSPTEGISWAKIAEIRTALHEIGLDETRLQTE